MATKRQKPTKHRNAVALSMILARKRTTIMKDRRTPRGGARNHEREFLQDVPDEATNPWPKSCVVCGEKYDKQTWLALPCIGVMKSDNIAEFPDHELRNCPCRNTLSMALPLPE